MRELMLYLRRRSGNPNDELGPVHRFTFHTDTAAVRLYDFFHQVQFQSCAVHLIPHRPAAAEEGIENPLLFIWWNTRSAIRDPDLDGRPLSSLTDDANTPIQLLPSTPYLTAFSTRFRSAWRIASPSASTIGRSGSIC